MSEEVLDLTNGLYRYLLASEDALLRSRRQAAEATVRLRERALFLQQRFQAAARSASDRASARMTTIAEGLREMAAAFEEKRTRRTALKARWTTLSEQYEAWLAHLKESRTALADARALPHVKPRNLWRNVFHVSVGVVLVAAYELLFSRHFLLIAGVASLALFAFMDVLRRVSDRWNERFVQKMFAKISRPGEAYRIPSASWYVLSLVLGVWLLPKHAVVVGALVLAFGDPMAALVGRRFGRIKLVGDKSLVGSLAFAVVSTLVVAGFAWLVIPGWGPLGGLGLGAATGVTGALTELASTRLDDNLTIPLAAGLVAMLLL